MLTLSPATDVSPATQLEDELIRLVNARLCDLDDPTLVPFLRQSLPSLRRALEDANRDRRGATGLSRLAVRCGACTVA